MRRLAIFAHYDAEHRVRPYVHHHLRALRSHCERVVFVSTSELPAAERASLRDTCSEVLLRENVGLDFAMWKHTIERVSPIDEDELVLTNSSVFGPVGSRLDQAFATMAQVDCDFWGVTDSVEIDWHLMSYFLVFRRPVHASPAFQRFFAHLLPMLTKAQIIRSYELGLSTYLVESGFRAAALVPVATLEPLPLVTRLLGGGRRNPTIFHAREILARGAPYVKVELFRDNRHGVELEPLRRAMAAGGYDLALIDPDLRSPIGAS